MKVKRGKIKSKKDKKLKDVKKTKRGRKKIEK
jgi:hypothetical protein